MPNGSIPRRHESWLLSPVDWALTPLGSCSQAASRSATSLAYAHCTSAASRSPRRARFSTRSLSDDSTSRFGNGSSPRRTATRSRYSSSRTRSHQQKRPQGSCADQRTPFRTGSKRASDCAWSRFQTRRDGYSSWSRSSRSAIRSSFTAPPQDSASAWRPSTPRRKKDSRDPRAMDISPSPASLRGLPIGDTPRTAIGTWRACRGARARRRTGPEGLAPRERSRRAG